VVAHHLPVKIHPDDRTGAIPQRVAGLVEVDEVGPFREVEEAGTGTEAEDREACRRERERRKRHLVVPADAAGPQRELDRVRSAPDSDAVRHAAVLRKGRLELLQALAEDEGHVVEDGAPAAGHLLGDLGVLSAQVDEGDPAKHRCSCRGLRPPVRLAAPTS
jgi:hypothetical protein